LLNLFTSELLKFWFFSGLWTTIAEVGESGAVGRKTEKRIRESYIYKII
jgi:hypothetical protein